MSDQPLKLVTKSDEATEDIRATLQRLLQKANDEKYTGMAAVMIRHDGAVFVTTRSNGNRVQILGAIADLQYTVAKDGDV